METTQTIRTQAAASMIHLEPAEVLSVLRAARSKGAREWAMIVIAYNAKMHNLKEDAKDVAKDTGAKKSSFEHGHLKVTNLKMVSDSCQK